MSQFYNLYLATETIANDAQQLNVAIEDLQHIQVQVSATLIQQPEPSLQLRYCVVLPLESLAAQLDWPTWQADKVGFTDFLWEETCLECFITNHTLLNNDIGNVIADTDAAHTASYIEINANPDGRYALYQFNRYRNPATLPPNPLFQIDGYTRAYIDWADKVALQKTVKTDTHSVNTLSTADKDHTYERSFSVPLAQLYSANNVSNNVSKHIFKHSQPYAINSIVIEQLHPCVILWFGETALYFAPEHASPPDFHNQRHWSTFKG